VYRNYQQTAARQERVWPLFKMLSSQADFTFEWGGGILEVELVRD